MDFNLYFAEWLVWERYREAQRLAARGWWWDPPSRPRRPLRVALGLAMIRAGHWILGSAPGYAGHPDAIGR